MRMFTAPFKRCLLSYSSKGYSQHSAREIPGLWLAASLGLTEIVEAMTTQDRSLDMGTAHAETALHGAAFNGQYTTAQLLLERGVKANVSGKSGRTALHGAASNGHYATVQLLLSTGRRSARKIKMDGRHFTERLRTDMT